MPRGRGRPPSNLTESRRQLLGMGKAPMSQGTTKNLPSIAPTRFHPPMHREIRIWVWIGISSDAIHLVRGRRVSRMEEWPRLSIDAGAASEAAQLRQGSSSSGSIRIRAQKHQKH